MLQRAVEEDEAVGGLIMIMIMMTTMIIVGVVEAMGGLLCQLCYRNMT